jgi:pimeloyl-ACP methyl ester carboxylesterase
MLKTLTLPHVDLAFEDTGKGPVVVFLHGFAEDGTVWKHQVAALAETYRVIVPDWPGSGLSPLGNHTPTVESFAELIYALLIHERIDQCCMIGHSMGGYVTLAFAEAYPHLLKGYGLFHSTAYADTEEKRQARRKGIAFIKENGVVPFVKQSTPNLFSDAYKQEQPEEITALLQRNAAFEPEALIGYYEAMVLRQDRTAILSRSKVPVLLICGALDVVIPIKDSLQMAAMPMMTFLTVLENAAHMGMCEDIQGANQAINEYLSYIY